MTLDQLSRRGRICLASCFAVPGAMIIGGCAAAIYYEIGIWFTVANCLLAAAVHKYLNHRALFYLDAILAAVAKREAEMLEEKIAFAFRDPSFVRFSYGDRPMRTVRDERTPEA